MNAKRPSHDRRSRSEGLMEVLIVVATLALLVLVALPLVVPHRRYSSGPRIRCISNLQKIGLAARTFSNDHGDLFPWDVSISSNGVKEIAMFGDIAAIFRSMSNELNSPNLLTCPSDTMRTRAPNFGQLANSNISYFIGLDANETMPQSIISGDRNISGGAFTSNRIMEVRATNVLTWGKDMHVYNGNVGLGDGSVQAITSVALQTQMLGQGTNVRRFAFP